ncbi:MAG: 3-dehydroquinate synthase [Candidatus Omnitrophica bacterium]|nr:3-dehydroquinate synthase [Candidatus Omnitrophota bacterium]
MKTILVKTSTSQYPVYVGSQLLSKLGSLFQDLSLGGKVLIVTQKKIAKHFLKPVQQSLKQKGYAVFVHEIPDGETAKSSKELFGLYRVLLKHGFERRDTILALGGGVVGDLSGFAAATYLRGVRFVNIGTTFLAQVDSSVGGKTGINLPEGKNLVGAFYPPKFVVSDVALFQTLPDREFRSSLAEVVKYGVIRSGELFRFLEDEADKILHRDERALEHLVLESVKIKAQVVASDEFEARGERMILNFGHTFGHGFEQATGYKKLLHGEAVAIGIVCASRLAVALKMFSEVEEKRVVALLQKFDLPVSLSGLSLKMASVLQAMQRDKKKSAGKLRWVLPTHIGDVLVRDDVPLPLIRKVIREAGGK